MFLLRKNVKDAVFKVVPLSLIEKDLITSVVIDKPWWIIVLWKMINISQ